MLRSQDLEGTEGLGDRRPERGPWAEPLVGVSGGESSQHVSIGADFRFEVPGQSSVVQS